MTPMDDTTIQALESALGTENEQIHTAIIEALGNVTVRDMTFRGRTIEAFADPHTVTGGELNNLQDVYDVKEIGVYGDPQLAGTDQGGKNEGTFYLLLKA